MPELYASQSSRFFAVREPGTLTLFRGRNPDLQHRVNDKLAGNLVRLGNNGDVFFRNGQNVYRLRREPGVKAQRPRVLAHLDGSPEGGTLGGFAVNADGREFCYEQVLQAKKLGSKLRGLFGKQEENVQATQRNIVLCNSISGQSVCFYDCLIDPRKTIGFRWAISPTFGFMVVAESGSNGQTICRLIDVIDESVVSEFTLSVERIDGVRVTDNGTVMLEVRVPGQERLVLWTYGQDRHLVALPPACFVHHFDQKRIVLMSQDRRYLIVKAYDDTLVANIDLSPLQEFNLVYLPHFTPKGAIELATFEAGRFRVHHTDVETLPIDANRWKMLQEQRRLEEEQQMLEQAMARQQKDQENLDYMRRSRQLEEAMNANIQRPTIRPVEPALPPPAASKPTRLEIERPKSPAPPPPQTEEARPERVDIVQPEAPTRLDVAASATPTKLDVASPSAPPTRLDVEPPKADALTVDTSKLSQIKTVANPNAPTLAGAGSVPAPDLSGLSVSEIEQELEALRMHYIAGELKREEYYKKKKELEDLKSEAVAEPPDSPQAGPPKNAPLMEGKRIELGGP